MDTIQEIVDALTNTGNFEVWVDYISLKEKDWTVELVEDGIKKAKVALIFLSPEYLESKFCCKEMEIVGTLNKQFIPVLLTALPENNTYPPKIDIGKYFMGHYYIDFTRTVNIPLLIDKQIRRRL